MRRVTKRELNQHTAATLAHVTETDDIVVTERGNPRWRVSAIGMEDSTSARLEHTGRYTPPAATPQAWPEKPEGPTYTAAEIDDMLGAMRGES